MLSVPASEFQKNFDDWHDKADQGPVEITQSGQASAFLISEKLFRQMWASFRQALPVEAFDEADIAALRQAQVETDRPFMLEDIPDAADDHCVPDRVI